MKRLLILITAMLPMLLHAQFTGTTAKGGNLTVIVTDGTYSNKNSPLRPPGGKFKDPIRSLGMVDAIQAGAFIDRPDYGLEGFLLIFCVNESIGGMQGTHVANGETFKGVYRLIRQKMKANEEVPPGMTLYRLEGTVFFLGIS
ncbi:MAG: hypothetical protein IPH04_00485 [Saprospirales bacterium]|nr:hypothetical protein [Saprospirales bacterium]MBK6901314.1 hypothetical protein [Saprospirales bacterium]MBK7335979.1 hypothetical protein [Saprospirales bacterium]